MLEKVKQHKYLIALTFFVIWMLFFDRNNLFEQIRLRANLNKLKAEREYYLLEIEKAKREYDELFTNDETLEKFAREKYLMKKDNEDIFVIVEKSEE